MQQDVGLSALGYARPLRCIVDELVPLDDQHAAARALGGGGREQTGEAGADHDDIDR